MCVPVNVVGVCVCTSNMVGVCVCVYERGECGCVYVCMSKVSVCVCVPVNVGVCA